MDLPDWLSFDGISDSANLIFTVTKHNNNKEPLQI